MLLSFPNCFLIGVVSPVIQIFNSASKSKIPPISFEKLLDTCHGIDNPTFEPVVLFCFSTNIRRLFVNIKHVPHYFIGLFNLFTIN
jgi:hypothetical protein